MDFLNFLKSNENSRRIFGKGELKIIEKQLMGINLTQSEKNRLSRDIRNKLKFISEAARFSEDFELKKSAIIKKTIKDTKEAIFEDILSRRIKRIILFGSAAENQLTFRSDIDIAVEFDKINIKEATLFRTRILGKVPARVDIQVYNYLPDKIKKEIDVKGRLLKII